MPRFKTENQKFNIYDDNNKLIISLDSEKARAVLKFKHKLVEFANGRPGYKDENDVFYKKKATEFLANGDFDRAAYYSERYLKEVEKQGSSKKLSEAQKWQEEFSSRLGLLKSA